MRLDLGLSDADQMLMNSGFDFLRRETPKLVIQDLLDTETGCTDTIWKKAAEMGWLGIIIPEAYGGLESTMESAGALFEALAPGPCPAPCFRLQSSEARSSWQPETRTKRRKF